MDSLYCYFILSILLIFSPSLSTFDLWSLIIQCAVYKIGIYFIFIFLKTKLFNPDELVSPLSTLIEFTQRHRNKHTDIERKSISNKKKIARKFCLNVSKSNGKLFSLHFVFVYFAFGVSVLYLW